MKTGEDPKNHWHVPSTDSSMNIMGFGMTNGKLRVVFETRGKHSTYQYATNDTSICCRWDQSTSIGHFFHQYVKPLSYVKVS